MASLSHGVIKFKVIGLNEMKAKLKRRNYDPHKWILAFEATKDKLIFRVRLIRKRAKEKAKS